MIKVKRAIKQVFRFKLVPCFVLQQFILMRSVQFVIQHKESTFPTNQKQDNQVSRSCKNKVKQLECWLLIGSAAVKIEIPYWMFLFGLFGLCFVTIATVLT